MKCISRELERQIVLPPNDITKMFEHIWRGGIVCMCDSPVPIDEKNSFIPGNLI